MYKEGSDLIVRRAIEKALEPKPNPPYEQTHLWVSSVGGCPRRAMFEFLGYEKEKEFPLSLLEKFRFGNVLEDDTGRVLREMYGEDLTDQVVLRDKIWSGKCDWGIRVGKPNPILIEHKATGSKWWRAYGTPPNESHIAQLVLYGQLYEEQYNLKPQLILYYRAWANYAELELQDLGDSVSVQGIMDGENFHDRIFIDVTKRRNYLEEYFDRRELPPYKLTNECEFQGAPSCAYFSQCHDKQNRTNVARWGNF